METETLDKLYLEWSQFTKARNARERAMLVALKFSEALRLGEIDDMVDLGWSMEGYETASAFAVRITQDAIAKATA